MTRPIMTRAEAETHLRGRCGDAAKRGWDRIAVYADALRLVVPDAEALVHVPPGVPDNDCVLISMTAPILAALAPPP